MRPKSYLMPLLALVLLSLPLFVPNVSAQTTMITNVSYTKSALFDLDTGTTNPPLILNATVGYSDAKTNYSLAVGVFDLDDGNLIDGLGSSTPQSCSSTAGYAGCIITLKQLAGSERMQFALAHPKGVWNLALIAALLDGSGNPVANSYSDYTFTINVQTGLTLVVDVPRNVTVEVDGVNGSGSVQIVLAAGAHRVAVPQIVQFGNSTRLVFSNWSDGSSNANRTVQLDHDITLHANYATQYFLQIISPVNVQGTGWYDAGTGVTMSASSTIEPMAGIMGILGGKWTLQHWSEDGREISRSTAAQLTMDSSHTVTIVWAPDYTSSILILVIVLVVATTSLYVVRRRLAFVPHRKHRRQRVSRRR